MFSHLALANGLGRRGEVGGCASCVYAGNDLGVRTGGGGGGRGWLPWWVGSGRSPLKVYPAPHPRLPAPTAQRLPLPPPPPPARPVSSWSSRTAAALAPCPRSPHPHPHATFRCRPCRLLAHVQASPGTPSPSACLSPGSCGRASLRWCPSRLRRGRRGHRLQKPNGCAGRKARRGEGRSVSTGCAVQTWEGWGVGRRRARLRLFSGALCAAGRAGGDNVAQWWHSMD